MSGAAFGFIVAYAAFYAIGLAMFCGADLLKIHRCVGRVLGDTKGKLHK